MTNAPYGNEGPQDLPQESRMETKLESDAEFDATRFKEAPPDVKKEVDVILDSLFADTYEGELSHE